MMTAAAKSAAAKSAAAKTLLGAASARRALGSREGRAQRLAPAVLAGALVATALGVAGCISVPDEVEAEFAAADGSRPNHFARIDLGGAEGPPSAPAAAAPVPAAGSER